MTFTLTKKIIAPYAVLGLLVLALLATTFAFDLKRQRVAAEERALLEVGVGVGAVSSRVQNGILTRKESFAIEAANAALRVDNFIDHLGEEGNALRFQFHSYFAAMVAINSVYLENRTAEGEKRLDQLREQERKIDETIARKLEEAQAQREHLATTSRIFEGVVLLVILGAIAMVGTLVVRTVVTPIKDMRNMIQGIAHGDGDLTARMTVASQDEIGEIAGAFNTMMAKLQDIMRFVIEASRDVSTAAESLAVTLTQTTEATQRQSGSAAATAATVEQVTVSIGQVADHAREAEAVTSDAAALAHEGRHSAEVAASQIAITAQSVTMAAQHVKTLNERSEQIRSIVGVIREIADQTNLLALNAAIEAARAGEQGRGFAVVADEVRKLAERTTTATAEIAGMIDAIRTDVTNAVDKIGEGNKLEAEQVANAESLRNILAQIGDAIDRSANRTQDIAAATREQTLAAEAMARNVEQIAQMAEEISTASSGSSELASAMRELAGKLHQHVGRFRV